MKPWQAYGMIILAATMWGSLGVMTKTLYSLGLNPWSLAFLRTLLGFLSFLAVVLVSSRASLRVSPRDLPFLALYGLVSTAAFHVLYLHTIEITSVAVAAVLLYTAPAFSTVIARFAFGESITPLKVVALFLTFGGCLLVAGIQAETPVVTPLAIVTGLGSALTYASFGLMGKQALERYDPLAINLYCIGFASIWLAPVPAITGSSLGPYPPEAWMLLVVMAVGPTMLSRLLYIVGLRHVEASRAAVAATVEPVSAAAFALAILGEALVPSQWAGGILVLSGAVLAQQSRRRS